MPVTSFKASPDESRFRAETADRMRYPAAAPQEVDLSGDPIWEKIQGSFNDILGSYANMDVEMPVALPDTNDPQDVLRYLTELEKAGVDSRAQASYLASGQRGGMQFSDALSMMKFLYQQNKDNMSMLAQVLPNIKDEKMQATLSTQLLNMMSPGYFGTEITGLMGGGGRTAMVSEQNVINTVEFQRISDAYKPQLAALARAKDNENYDLMMNQIERLLKEQYKWPDNIVEAALQKIHADAISAKMAAGDMYGEL